MSDPSPVESAAPPETPPPSEPTICRLNAAVLVAAAALVILVIAVIAAPLWAPPVMQLLPWGGAPPAKPQAAAPPPAPPAAPAPAPAAAPDPALAALRAQATQNAATLQALSEQLAKLAAKPSPAPDLTPLQQQIAAQSASIDDMKQKIAGLEKAAQAAPADATALVLVLLQIDDAIAVGRPFAAEYQTLTMLAHGRADIAEAAVPLAGPAAGGVASRAVLAARLHQLAPQIATAAAPGKPGWRSQIVARLRALVTIRRIDGADQTPAEAAVGSAERELAGGDLDAAIAALSGLGGAHLVAAQPWLAMARQRLQVETTLRHLQTLVTAQLGGAATLPAKPG